MPSWVGGSDEIFEHLAEAVPWRAERRAMYERVVDVPRLLSWYGDTIGRSRHEDTMVAIVSLGAARRFLLRSRLGGESIGFALGHGDVLVMGGSCQRTWEHAIPKTNRDVGPRISVQFRPRGVR